MMVIGANTPAMIKAMTAEVESKNLIVASMHLSIEKLSGRHVTASAMRPLPAPAFAPG
jgi:hypothetical protein